MLCKSLKLSKLLSIVNQSGFLPRDMFPFTNDMYMRRSVESPQLKETTKFIIIRELSYSPCILSATLLLRNNKVISLMRYNLHNFREFPQRVENFSSGTTAILESLEDIGHPTLRKFSFGLPLEILKCLML